MIIFVVFGIVVLMLVIMAVFLLSGKGAFLIAGYNTMTKSEKAKYDEKALGRFNGWLLIAISFLLLLVPVGMYLGMAWLAYGGFALVFVGTIGAVIYENTGSRFRRDSGAEDPAAQAKTHAGASASKATIITISAIAAIVLVGVGVMFYQGEKDPLVKVLDERIEIKAVYGLSVDFADISDVSLIEKSMRDMGIGTRTNGYGGASEALKGHFESDSLGKTLLFVQSESSPTIRIERNGKPDIYISFRDGEKTRSLYDELARH